MSGLGTMSYAIVQTDEGGWSSNLSVGTFAPPVEGFRQVWWLLAASGGIVSALCLRLPRPATGG